MPETTYAPIPPRDSYFKEDPRATLTESEQGMYNEVLAHFTKEGYVLPDVEKGELTEKEKFWLSRECFLRYLRATKWKVSYAITRVETTLKWRRTYGFYDLLTTEYVEPEAVTGKEVVFGFDTSGRPAFYMNPALQNTTDPVKQNQFAVWMMERGIDVMKPGVETVDLLIDFAQRAKHPSLSQSREFLSILQDHYPERLGLAIQLNVPFFVNMFLKLITPFIDPHTRNKLKFNPVVVAEKIFDADQVTTTWGGDVVFEYDHSKYWNEMVKQSEANVTQWTATWRTLGGTIGISEWAYKGGDISEKVMEIVEKTTVKSTPAAAVVVEEVVPAAIGTSEKEVPKDTNTPDLVDKPIVVVPPIAAEVETKKEDQKEVKAVPAVLEDSSVPQATVDATSTTQLEDDKGGKSGGKQDQVTPQGAPAAVGGTSGEGAAGGGGAVSASSGGDSGGGDGGGGGGGGGE